MRSRASICTALPANAALEAAAGFSIDTRMPEVGEWLDL
jgi:hypothetical protein